MEAVLAMISDRRPHFHDQIDILLYSLSIEYGSTVPGTMERPLFKGSTLDFLVVPPLLVGARDYEKEVSKKNIMRYVKERYESDALNTEVFNLLNRFTVFHGQFWLDYISRVKATTFKMLYQIFEDLSKMKELVFADPLGHIDSLLAAYICSQNYKMLQDMRVFGRYHFRAALCQVENKYELGCYVNEDLTALLDLVQRMMFTEFKLCGDLDLRNVIEIFRFSRGVHTVVIRRGYHSVGLCLVYYYPRTSNLSPVEYICANGVLRVACMSSGGSFTYTLFPEPKIKFEDFKYVKLDNENNLVEPYYYQTKRFPPGLNPRQLREAIREYATIKYMNNEDQKRAVLSDMLYIRDQEINFPFWRNAMKTSNPGYPEIYDRRLYLAYIDALRAILVRNGHSPNSLPIFDSMYFDELMFNHLMSDIIARSRNIMFGPSHFDLGTISILRNSSDFEVRFDEENTRVLTLGNNPLMRSAYQQIYSKMRKVYRNNLSPPQLVYTYADPFYMSIEDYACTYVHRKSHAMGGGSSAYTDTLLIFVYEQGVIEPFICITSQYNPYMKIYPNISKRVKF